MTAYPTVQDAVEAAVGLSQRLDELIAAARANALVADSAPEASKVPEVPKAPEAVAAASPTASHGPRVVVDPGSGTDPLPTAPHGPDVAVDPDAIADPASTASHGPHTVVDPDSGAAASADAVQRRHIEDLTRRLNQRTATSKDLAQRHRRVLADSRASVGFRRGTKEMLYPIAARSARGSRLVDVEGNEYVDITMGFGALLLGHEADPVTEAVRAHLAGGVRLGPRSETTGEVAQLIADLTGHERVAFASSGTEANSAALRLARAATGRDKVVMFSGSYHGHIDSVLGRRVGRGTEFGTVPVSPGIPASAVAELIVLEYGSPEALSTIDALGDSIAAVVVEPVQCRNPALRPIEFVRELRELTRRRGIVLVFDEMLTGFRPHQRGAQDLYGVVPDLATYGKAIGGGYPIGVIAGRADIMDGVDGGFWQYGDDSFPVRDTTFFGGTYMQHPVSMAAAKAVLTHLKEQGPGLQERLNARTTRLADTLNTYFSEQDFPLQLDHFGSMFRFTHRADMELLYRHLLLRGIYVWEWRSFYLSTAHTDDDTDRIVDAVTGSLQELREAGFHPSSAPRPVATRQETVEQRRPAPDFSVYFFGDYPQDEAGPDKYALLTETARFADERGFHSVWFPERHFKDFGALFPNPSVLASALSQQTTRIRLNAGSVVLPLHDPVRVAEEWSMVDNLSGGRVGLGCASGWHSDDFALHPDRFDRRKDLTLEYVEQVRALWSGQSIPRRTGNGSQVDVRLYPRPVQALPPMFLATGGDPDTFERAARADLGIVTNLMKQSVEELAENIRRYRKLRADHGLDPGAGRVTVLLHTYLADDHDAARAAAFEPMRAYLRSSLFMRSTAPAGGAVNVESTSADDLDYLFRDAYARYCDDRALIGSPESCLAVIERLRAAGVDEVAALVDFGMEPEQLRSSMQLLDGLRSRFHPEQDPAAGDAVPGSAAPESAAPRPSAPGAEAPASTFAGSAARHLSAPGSAEPDSAVPSSAASGSAVLHASAPRPSPPHASASAPHATAPATPFQQRLWRACQITGASAYNEIQAAHFRGELDEAALATAMKTLIMRHDGLRTTFRTDGLGGELRQHVSPVPAAELTVVDRRGRDPEAAIRDALREASERRCDPAEGPLFNPVLIRLADDDHVLVLGIHHLITDGHSAGIIASDLHAAYAATSAGRAPHFERPAGTALDAAPRPQNLAEDLHWWRSRLGAIPPVLRVPTDFPRTRSVRGVGASCSATLSSDRSEQLRSWSGRQGVTLYATLLTAWQIVLRRFSGQDDFLVGSTFGLRTEADRDTVGFFAEVLPVRCSLADDTEIRAAVRATRDALFEASAHRNADLGELLAELSPDPGAARPVITVAADLDTESLAEIGLPGLQARGVDGGSDAAPFELGLQAIQTSNGLRIRIRYDADLYAAPTVQRYIDHLCLVLDGFVEGAERVGALVLRTPADVSLSATLGTGPALVRTAATMDRVRPAESGRPAVVAGNTVRSGRELGRAADAVTARLTALGVGRGDVVAVLLGRGADYAAAVLGVVASGAAYLPLDAVSPRLRLAAMIADSRPVALICGSDNADPNDASLADGLPRVHVEWEPESVAAVVAEPTIVTPDDEFCRLYTSGSTGAPKGIRIGHGNMSATLGGFCADLAITDQDRIAWFSSVGFDAAHIELWPAIATGAELHVVPDEVRLDPARLIQWYTDNRITLAWLPTAMAEQVTGLEWPEGCALRYLGTGGEQLNTRPRADLPFTLLNSYGPTETTVLCTWAPVTSNGVGKPAIGVATRGARLKVCDPAGRELPPDAVGELHVGGEQVALGYHGADASDAERFSTDSDGRRWYRTGDLVRWGADEQLHFHGRADGQVKIRGVRVEPAEVTPAVCDLPGVRAARVVGTVDPETGHGSLTCFVVPNEPVGDMAGQIMRWRRQLRAALARPMIPDTWRIVSELSLTTSGKWDPDALSGKRDPHAFSGMRDPHPVLRTAHHAPDVTVDVTADVTVDIRRHWAEALDVDISAVTADADLFDLGGHSITAIRLLNRLREAFGLEISMSEFFADPSVESIVDRVTAAVHVGRVRGEV